MSILVPLVTIYLLGIATPILIVRIALSRILAEDEGGCIIDFILLWILLLIFSMFYLWLKEVMPL